MTLTTRCPRCGTVYQLVADQLKLHHGLVRCGHCQEIFDGAARQVEPLLLTNVAVQPDDGSDARDTGPSPDRAACKLIDNGPLEPAFHPHGVSTPFSVTREIPVPSHRGTLRRVGWLVSLTLTVLLIAQIAWWQRERIVTAWPRTEAVYTLACTQLGCIVPPPRDIDGLAIEQTSLRQTGTAHQLELHFSLHNRDAVALAYPDLEVTLLSSNSDIVVRRVLRPSEYLPSVASEHRGVPARTVQPIAVRLDVGSVDAADYRVQIFYP
ncbi:MULTISPECIES: zinc-ribbon and DUF3426 domain-containing protein [Mycetohabitans]|uniref:zinc-ribbon and DUF3426 domain-containing protein n=1 Tax=Mycetohabitans TaxID=2571159 RepID=UPI001F3C9539|nr:zinc-ribbon and DUF3426 domain-containing protein [Mycetohabitans sp. B3]MCF2132857.1 zinc-ribbon domain-containing protein [Mycetohabitans sp. B3]